MNLKKNQIIIFSILVVISMLLVLKQNVIHVISQIYFDEQYYLKTYPEIADLRMSPFKHYSEIGWKEGKNPSADIDNNFYMRTHEGWDKSMLGANPLEHITACRLSSEECYANPGQLKKVELLKNPKYYLTIVSLFRDEARFLKEWIEFYKLMGVEHFYLYNHLSKDNYMEVLKPYIEDGTVELKDVAVVPKDEDNWYNGIHFKVYNEVVEKARDDAEWLIIVDSDEFLFPVEGKDLKSVLKKYDDYPSVSVNWKLFGSSEVNKIAEGKLLTESLMMTAKSDDKAERCKGTYSKCYNNAFDNLHVKSIVKPRYVELIDNPHFAKLKPGYAQITENYEYFYGSFSYYPSRKVMTINHYWGRDWEFFKSSKLSRVHLIDNGLTAGERESRVNQAIKHNKDASRVYDGLIQRFIPTLRAKVFAGKAGSN